MRILSLIILTYFINTNICFALNQNFFKQADELAKLETQHFILSRKFKVLVSLLVDKSNNQSAEDIRKFDSPNKYYSLSTAKRKFYKREYQKLHLAEKFYTEPEFLKNIYDINKFKSKLAVELGKQSADSRKNAAFDFHNEKMTIHDSVLDLILGIDYEDTEAKLLNEDYGYDGVIGSFKENSQTGYQDLRVLFRNLSLNEKDVFYDLGSGYGRVLLYGAILNPQVKFKGIELVAERSQHAQKAADGLKATNVLNIAGSFFDIKFEDGNVFYLNSSSLSLNQKLLPTIKKIAENKPIKVIGLSHTTTFLKTLDWLEVEKNLTPDRESHNTLTLFRSK